MSKALKITRIVKTDADRNKHIQHLLQRELPYTSTEQDGIKIKRTTPQNSLQHLWLTEIAAQKPDYDYEQYRGLCKLYFGVPILCAADAEYEAVYESDVRPLPLKIQTKLMMRPIDLPVTRLMNKKQMDEYLYKIQYHFRTKHNLILTEPNEGLFYE